MATPLQRLAHFIPPLARHLPQISHRSPSEYLSSFHLGIALLEAIHNDDPTALVGLPLIRTARLLRAAGLTLP